MTSADNEQLWERNAAWWQAEYTVGADPEYEDQILPLVERHLIGARRVLDVGCGEGQVARHLAAVGIDVIGLDPTSSQVRVARERAGGPQFARARAEALPCRDGAFDAVLLCLALEHVDAFEAAIDNVARVLEPGGRFVLVLCHPLLQTPGSGWIDDHILDPPEQYWRIGPYLPEAVNTEEVERDVFIRFVHRPLHRYVNGMLDVGLTIERLLEPAPPPGFVRRAPEYQQAETVPRLMVLVARRR